MAIWIWNNLVGTIGIIVGGFIAYHVYFLSKKINLKDRLSHKDSIIKRVQPLLENIRNGINVEVELVNVKKYLKYYPHNNSLNKNGYTYMRAELKALRFDGVEFFCEVQAIYKKPNGKFSLTNGERYIKQDKNTLVGGTIPYEWIEHVDPNGDEFSYRPQFFTNFKGDGKSPYKRFSFYIESDTYQKGSDPTDWQWKSIDVETSN